MFVGNAIVSTLSFTLVLLGVFFLPGFVLFRFAFTSLRLSFFEEALFSFVLSIGLLDVVMLILGRIGVPLSPPNIALGLLCVVGSLYALTKGFAIWKGDTSAPTAELEPEKSFTKKGTALFLLLLFATFFVRVIYFSDAGLPSATDMGHHLYWAKLITETQQLPVYEKIEVVLKSDGQALLAPPSPIADFIIGEHLPFAVLAAFTGLDFTSAAPVNFLFFINFLTILAVATLAWRLAHTWQDQSSRITPENIFLAVFLFVGPLYALASPQAKFVSGGVIGNLFGNLFIPLILLSFFRAFSEKKYGFFLIGVFLSFILAFTHHLSTLVLLFILVGFFAGSLVMNPRKSLETLKDWFQPLLTSEMLTLLFGIILFLLCIAVPSYLEKEAIDSALGTPTKSTRTGLSFLQTTNTVGLVKIALGLTGLFYLVITKWRKTSAGALLIGWGGILLVMTLFPHLLLLDIPSNRIGSYLVFPLSLAAGLVLVIILGWFTRSTYPAFSSKYSLPFLPTMFIVSVIFIVTLANGSLENTQSLLSAPKAKAVTQTFAVSRYLAEYNKESDLILKDHNYITADAWMKLFFLRDYGYPLSRGFFSRYTEGGSRRERCTLDMISVPNTQEGKKCFEETGVNLIVVNPEYDVTQFEKSRDFSRWYESPLIHVYERRTEGNAPATIAPANPLSSLAQ